MKHRKPFREERPQSEHRINNQIRFSPVRLIGDNGEQIGTVPVDEAKKRAVQAGLDLVEVAPNARPIVCRIMDYGKFKYEQSQKEKKNKKTSSTELKHIRLSPKIGDHDIETKVRNAEKFLKAGHNVQFKLEYKRRENAHKDLGFEVIDKILEALSEIADPQRKPKLDGRFLICIVEPK